MDNIKEKLIELLEKADEWATEKCDEMDCDECPADKTLYNCMDYLVADHLIANGVTIQKWIPVSERLPESDKIVLVFTAHSSAKVARCNIYGNGTRVIWETNDGLGEKAITHWMPLPEPPKGE